MAKKIRNFAAILAVSAVVGTILLVLVFLLPVGPMRKNVEKSVGDMLKTGDEIPEDAFSQYLWKNRETYTDAIMVQNAIERLPDKMPTNTLCGCTTMIWKRMYGHRRILSNPSVNPMRTSITCISTFMRDTGTAIFYI